MASFKAFADGYNLSLEYGGNVEAAVVSVNSLEADLGIIASTSAS